MEKNHTIDDILQVASSYLQEESNLNLIKKAYDVAFNMHQGQLRKSGEPYVIHPIEVAYSLALLHTGPATISAGLVHDVLEDTPMTPDEMSAILGPDVVHIVEGVTKIGNLRYMTKDKALASNHQRILLAMAKDIRVVLVKLVDRLHNMRTLDYLPLEKQQRIAKETLDLYAPLAHRLGMYRIKAELEDLSFKYLANDEYHAIAEAIAIRKSERADDIEQMIVHIEKLLDDHHIDHYDIKGRIKNIYSIYKKISLKAKTIDEIYDMLALRIIVDSVEDCYHVLGLIHGEWNPLPMRFKDYIAVPKPNLYQSLHTTVVGFEGRIFEIQIRTYEMDQIAELGVAAHWAYKEENKNYTPQNEQLEITNRLKWYKDLSTYVEDHESVDPLDSIIEDIFSANVYVFTPNGDVIDLPSGSMPLDFAYRIHSGVGEKTVGAIVNGKIVPLNYKLKTGDVVEIKTNRNISGPTKDWLKHVKTSHARHKIKAFINKQQRDDLILRGQNDLEKICKMANYNINLIDDNVIESFYKRNNIHTLEELCYEVGKGHISPISIINKVTGLTDIKVTDEELLKQYSEANAKKSPNRIHSSQYGVYVDGLEKASLKLGNCCQPIYGDEICGYIAKGTGIVVHRKDCPNVLKNDPERAIDVTWEKGITGKLYDTTLKIYAMDKRNLVADMINIINGTRVSISSVTSTKNKLNECITKFKLQVANIDELNHVIIALSKMSEIYQIDRLVK